MPKTMRGTVVHEFRKPLVETAKPEQINDVFDLMRSGDIRGRIVRDFIQTA